MTPRGLRNLASFLDDLNSHRVDNDLDIGEIYMRVDGVLVQVKLDCDIEQFVAVAR